MAVYATTIALSTIAAMGVNVSHGFKKKWFFFLTFMVLFLVAALRYDTAIDYWHYVDYFNWYATLGFSPSEIGYNLLMKAVQALGLNVQWMFIIVSFVTILLAMKYYQKYSKNFAFSIFAYCTLNYYFFAFNSIRVYLAMSMALWAMHFLKQGKFIKFVLLVLFASTFHLSVLVVFLLYGIPYVLKVKSQRDMIKMFLFTQACGIMMNLSKGFFRNIIFFFYPSYEGSVFDQGEISYMNILVSGAILLLYFVYYKNIKEQGLEYGFDFTLICIVFSMYIHGTWIPEYSRIGYMALLTAPVLVANIIESQRNKKNRFILYSVAGLLMMCLWIVCAVVAYPAKGYELLPYHFASLEWIFG